MALSEGQRLSGRYTLIRRLGSGGMADVWLAEDEMLGRNVALKLLHERFAQDEQFVERFRREAQAAAGLQHPNLVGVYDRGEAEGRPWIAMEYVEGAMLKDLIARGLAVGEAVEIVRQVLTGVKYAHAHGIVHRDLKPQNVLVDREGRARVADFGIARAGASDITATGSVLGTAQYLSPEQAQGLEITAASDIYSVGVILYEGLTGRVPFDAETPVAVALKQVSEQPRRPSEQNPAVPPALDSVTLRALAKDPQNRYGSAAEFLEALDRAEADPQAAGGDTATIAAVGAGGLAGGAAGAPTPAGILAPPTDREGPWTRRRLLVIAALAAIAAAIAIWALTRPGDVRVPSVIGENVSVARLALENDGFEVVETPLPSCTPDGTVTEQDPLAGTEAQEGSEVRLTVSEGRIIEVPDVAGEPAADAREILADDELRVREKRRGSQQVDAGRVISTEPAAGEEVECESAVTLIVSSGPNVVAMPNLVGQEQEFAEAELRRLDLIVDIETRDADEPEGTVIDQNPPAGAEVNRRDTVTLVVSTGAGSVVVPDVEGQPRETAISALSGEGLNVDVVEQETNNPDRDDRVLDQAPESGTRLSRGDTVTIFVGVLREPEPDPEPPGDTTTPNTVEPPGTGSAPGDRATGTGDPGLGGLFDRRRRAAP